MQYNALDHATTGTGVRRVSGRWAVVMDLLAASLTECVAKLTGCPVDELPQPASAGDEWRAVLGQWLARRHVGLVSVARPGSFGWPGHWIGIVGPGSAAEEVVAVILFGPPPAVIASPAAPALIGSTPSPPSRDAD